MFFARFSRLFQILQSLAGSGVPLTKLIGMVPGIFSALSRLKDAETSRDYVGIAIDIVSPLAPMTETDIDDGFLIALRALNNDTDFHDWVDAKLAMGEDLGDSDEIPNDVLILRYQIKDEEDLGTIPATAQAFNVGMAIPLLIRFLPDILELLRSLRGMKQTMQLEAAA